MIDTNRTDVDRMMEAAAVLNAGAFLAVPALLPDELDDEELQDGRRGINAIDLAAILAAGEWLRQGISSKAGAAKAWDTATAKLREGTG